MICLPFLSTNWLRIAMLFPCLGAIGRLNRLSPGQAGTQTGRLQAGKQVNRLGSRCSRADSHSTQPPMILSLFPRVLACLPACLPALGGRSWCSVGLGCGSDSASRNRRSQTCPLAGSGSSPLVGRGTSSRPSEVCGCDSHRRRREMTGGEAAVLQPLSLTHQQPSEHMRINNSHRFRIQ